MGSITRQAVALALIVGPWFGPARASDPMRLVDRRPLDVVQGCTAEIDPEVLVLFSPINPKGSLTIKPEVRTEAAAMITARPRVTAPDGIQVTVFGLSVEDRRVDYVEGDETVPNWSGYAIRARVRVAVDERLRPGTYAVRVGLPGLHEFANDCGDRILETSSQLAGEPGAGYVIEVRVYETANDMEAAQRRRGEAAVPTPPDRTWRVAGLGGLFGVLSGALIGYLAGRVTRTRREPRARPGPADSNPFA